MSNETPALATAPAATEDPLIKLFTTGDLIDLDPKQKAQYLAALCSKLGLNPLSKPFDILYLKGPDGKLRAILYANRTASDQLREIHNIKSEVVYAGPLRLGATIREDVYTVELDITKGERTERAVGCVSIAGLSGEALSNSIMKCWTKAMRRGTLSIVGLGLPDECEIDSIPGSGPRVLIPESAGQSGEPKTNFPKPMPAAKPPIR